MQWNKAGKHELTVILWQIFPGSLPLGYWRFWFSFQQSLEPVHYGWQGCWTRSHAAVTSVTSLSYLRGLVPSAWGWYLIQFRKEREAVHSLAELGQVAGLYNCSAEESLCSVRGRPSWDKELCGSLWAEWRRILIPPSEVRESSAYDGKQDLHFYVHLLCLDNKVLKQRLQTFLDIDNSPG